MKLNPFWRKSALVFLLIFGTLTKSWATENERRFTPLATIVKSQFIPTLSRGVGQYWMAWDELVPAHQNLLLHLSELSTSEKEAALETVRSTPPKPNQPLSDRFRSLILLGLGDKDVWLKVAGEVQQGSLLAQLTVDYLPQIAETLSPTLKNQILKEITKDYVNLSKGGFRTETSVIAPKRLADVYIKHLLRGDLLIEEMIENGSSVEEAFKTFITQMHSYIHGEDLYTADEILNLLRLLQKQIADDFDDHSIIVGGSLPNGKAFRTKSDLDFSRMFPFTASIQKRIEDSLKEYIFRQGHLSACELKLSHVENRNPLNFFGEKQSLAFEITAKKIELVTFGPRGEKNFYELGKIK